MTNNNSILCQNAREDGISLGEASEVQGLTFGSAVKSIATSVAVGIATGVGLALGAKVIRRIFDREGDEKQVSLDDLNIKLTVPLSQADNMIEQATARTKTAKEEKERKEKEEAEKKKAEEEAKKGTKDKEAERDAA